MATDKVSLKDKIDGTVRGTFGAAWDGLFNPHAKENLRKQYQSSFYTPSSSMPDIIEAKYNAAMRRNRQRLWKGTTEVAASGFGKGLLITAIAIVAIFAVVGAIGLLGGIPSIAGELAPTVAEGVAQGVNAALNFMLASIAGPVILAVGGTLGAVNDVRKEQDKISAEIAREEAQDYARIRELSQAQEVAAVKDVGPQGMAGPEAAAVREAMPTSFAAREAQRQQASPLRAL